MWANPMETADLAHLLKKPLMEHFILCAMTMKNYNVLIVLNRHNENGARYTL